MKRTWGPRQAKIVAARQKWCCWYCNELLPSTFELDHIKPLHLGGLDDYEQNAAAACPSCHAAKTQKEMIELTKRRRKAKRDAVEERTKAIERATSEDPLPAVLALKTVAPRKRKPPPPPMPGDPDFVDNLTVDNPFLRFAYHTSSTTVAL